MRITNELDYARDIAVPGGFITVDAGATVDLAEQLSGDDAAELGARLCEQDGWSPAKRRRGSSSSSDTSSTADTTDANGGTTDADQTARTVEEVQGELDTLHALQNDIDDSDPQYAELAALIADTEAELAALTAGNDNEGVS